ncbi:MAG: PH domain-containing protein [Candidatus Methanogranum gryphiswaldense]|nr:MAG: PH domain-containing protein [Candidatus Methanogranum sp. U3.2.1]
MEDSIAFRTKFGNFFWLSITIITTIVLIFLFLFKHPSIILTLFALIILTLIVSGYYTRYTFETNELIIKCPMAFNEPPVIYSSVKKIVDKHIWTYSLGMSSDSVLIYYGKNNLVCISPANKQEFIRILKERCPQAEFISVIH